MDQWYLTQTEETIDFVGNGWIRYDNSSKIDSNSEFLWNVSVEHHEKVDKYFNTVLMQFRLELKDGTLDNDFCCCK